jgi:hypothetical protein
MDDLDELDGDVLHSFKNILPPNIPSHKRVERVAPWRKNIWSAYASFGL